MQLLIFRDNLEIPVTSDAK